MYDNLLTSFCLRRQHIVINVVLKHQNHQPLLGKWIKWIKCLNKVMKSGVIFLCS